MGGDVSKQNRQGWSEFTYEAWIRGKGTPEQIALKLREDPFKSISPFGAYLKTVEGLRIANLLGSYGKLAVSLALLGGEVTVVDISPENARFANDLAQAAGVNINYVVSDVMEIPVDEFQSYFDLVIMELGILHWIMDLPRFFAIVSRILKHGGRVILRDFHPIKRQLLRWENGQMIASGNYFDKSIYEGYVPYAIFLNEEEKKTLTKVRTRGWTLGEIITNMVESGLTIQALNEESGPIQRWLFPDDAEPGIENRLPGIYTIVADKKQLTISTSS